MGRTRRAGGDAAAEVDRGVPVQLLQAGFQQRGLDDLAFAGALLVLIRGQHAARGQQARIDVGPGIAGAQRRAAGFAGNGHQAGEALRHQGEAALVGVGAGGAVPRYGAIDQAGVFLAQRGVAQPQLFHRALAEVLGDHVGVADHAQQDLLALGVFQVQGDGALVAIEHEGRP
ncbi:hypothetical protein G6F31_018197 [Rhizopus arrhizus]|nr:hypothetical protein G6F31_018197 [Rhizopus arrhizus]